MGNITESPIDSNITESPIDSNITESPIDSNTTASPSNTTSTTTTTTAEPDSASMVIDSIMNGTTPGFAQQWQVVDGMITGMSVTDNNQTGASVFRTQNRNLEPKSQ